MTVSYKSEVTTAGGFPSCFLRLLRKWRGSIFKLIYIDLIVFVLTFYGIALMNAFLFNAEQKRIFDHIVAYFSKYREMIPLSFVMGFYVKIVVKRWWDQLIIQPSPDPLAIAVSSLLQGKGERSRKMRRSVMRYACLSQLMVYRMISPRIQKRFPTYSEMVAYGLMTEKEKHIMMSLDKMYPMHFKYWMPIGWASNILSRARKEARIADDFALRVLNDELNEFRSRCMTLSHYDMITVPLVYTQTVTLAVYAYFGCALIGTQWTTCSVFDIALEYVPLFGMLEFMFFMGWLKVAETLICPFGDDDDDFEVNDWIDRNIRVSFLIVDGMHQAHPTLLRDQYWDYLAADMPYDDNIPEHSTARYSAAKPRRKKKPKMSNVGEMLQITKSLARLSYKSKQDPEAAERLRTLGPIKSLISSSTKSKSIIAPIWPDSNRSRFSISSVELENSFEELRLERRRQRLERHSNQLQRTVNIITGEQVELGRQIHARQPLNCLMLRRLSSVTAEIIQNDQDATETGDVKGKRRKINSRKAKDD